MIIIKATIRDVAKRASVSVATVSRVINNKGSVYEETRKVVLQAIEELGFEPSQLARSLTNRHSKMIGVMVPHIGSSFYGQLIEGIEFAAKTYGYKVMLCNTQDDLAIEAEYLKIFEQYNVEGIIIASNFLNTSKLDSITIPIVSVDHFLNENIPSITCNNEEGGKIAAKKLIADGCKNFLLLRGPSFLMTVQERTRGFVEVLEEHDFSYDMHDFDLLGPNIDFIFQYLKNNPSIDGIFALSDNLALIACGILNRLGRDVPNDVEIIGFDDVSFTKWTNPPITTVRQPIKYMGAEAFNILIKLINNEQLAIKHLNVDVELKLRGTTK